MNQNYHDLYGVEAAPVPSAAAVKPKTVYAGRDVILAFSAMLCGFFCVRFVAWHPPGLLTTLLFWAMLTGGVVYLRKSGRTFSRTHVLLTAVLYVFSSLYTLTDNALLKGLNTVYLLLTGALLVFMLCRPEADVFRYLPFTLPKAAAGMPLTGFGKCFGAAASAAKAGSVWKNAGYCVAGLITAVPLTVIVAALLCSADDNMADALGLLRDIPTDDLAILIPQIGIGILIGCYFFGMLWTNVHAAAAIPESEYDSSIAGLRILPNPMVYAAVTPVCLLYILYFILQIPYFIGGFTGHLAEGYTYAEYARQGFFELCIICCINLAVIAVLCFGARFTGMMKPLVLKIYTLFMSISSIVLAGTAIAKMVLYIGAYGMTPLRIYTTWFMVLLILGFVLIILRQFLPRLPVCRISFAVFTVMFALLCFSRPEAWMTRYNAEMYLAGQLSEFDTALASDMSDDAAAVLCQYPALLDETGEREIARCLAGYERDFYTALDLSAWQILLRTGGKA
ncbi:MAG: DUF4173 domain-containing protein [Ruminococcus sp.]|nr:DUF4173 domain-containing protein [Ruminococcus sp.]